MGLRFKYSPVVIKMQPHFDEAQMCVPDKAGDFIWV